MHECANRVLLLTVALQGVCMLFLLHPSCWKPGTIHLEEDLSVIRLSSPEGCKELACSGNIPVLNKLLQDLRVADLFVSLYWASNHHARTGCRRPANCNNSKLRTQRAVSYHREDWDQPSYPAAVSGYQEVCTLVQSDSNQGNVTWCCTCVVETL